MPATSPGPVPVEEGSTQLPRSLRSRVLGTTGIPFPLPFGVVFTFVLLSALSPESWDVPAEDRLSPAGAALTVALLATFAIGGVVLGVAEWRRSVTLTKNAIEIHTGWKERSVPARDIEAVEFRQLPMGRGTAPGAVALLMDGSSVPLRALLQNGRRVRQSQVDLLAPWCASRGIAIRSDGSWWWRGIDLPGRPDGLRAATVQDRP